MSLATFDRLRDQAALQLDGQADREAALRAHATRPGPAAPRPGRPARAVAARRLLRHRGGPVDRRRRPGVPARLVGGRRRGGPLPPDLGARPRRGEGRLRGVRRPRHRPARARPRRCTSTTTPRTRRPPSSGSCSRHATREDEVDRLLRGERPRRPLPGRPPGHPRLGRVVLDQADREVLHADARGPGHPRPGSASSSTRRWLRDHDPQHLRDLADYNRDDCVSTRVLRDWLEDRRLEAEARFGATFERPRPASGLPTEATGGASPRRRPAPDRARTPCGRGRSRGGGADPSRPPAGCSPRSSTGIGATRSRPGGTTSGSRELSLEDLIGETEPLGGLRYVESRRRRSASRSSIA